MSSILPLVTHITHCTHVQVAMDRDLFDEFDNYIGPELESDDSEGEDGDGDKSPDMGEEEVCCGNLGE